MYLHYYVETITFRKIYIPLYLGAFFRKEIYLYGYKGHVREIYIVF